MLLLADSITSFSCMRHKLAFMKIYGSRFGRIRWSVPRMSSGMGLPTSNLNGDRPKTRNTTNTTRWQKAVDTSRLRYLWHLVTSCDILWHLVTSCDILWHSCDILWQYRPAAAQPRPCPLSRSDFSSRPKVLASWEVSGAAALWCVATCGTIHMQFICNCSSCMQNYSKLYKTMQYVIVVGSVGGSLFRAYFGQSHAPTAQHASIASIARQKETP